MIRFGMLLTLGGALLGAGAACSAPFHKTARSTLTAYVNEQASVEMTSSPAFRTDSDSQQPPVVTASVRGMALDIPSALRIAVKAEPSVVPLFRSGLTPAHVVRWDDNFKGTGSVHNLSLTPDAYTEIAVAAPDTCSLSLSNLTFQLSGAEWGQPSDRPVRMSWKVEYLGL